MNSWVLASSAPHAYLMVVRTLAYHRPRGAHPKTPIPWLPWPLCVPSCHRHARRKVSERESHVQPILLMQSASQQMQYGIFSAWFVLSTRTPIVCSTCPLLLLPGEKQSAERALHLPIRQPGHSDHATRMMWAHASVVEGPTEKMPLRPSFCESVMKKDVSRNEYVYTESNGTGVRDGRISSHLDVRAVRSFLGLPELHHPAQPFRTANLLFADRSGIRRYLHRELAPLAVRAADKPAQACETGSPA